MIPFYRPYCSWSELLAALRPGVGRSDFESALATRVGAQYGIAFAYGRSGVTASLKALGLSQVEVIMPAYTCLVMVQKASSHNRSHTIAGSVSIAGGFSSAGECR